MRFRPCIDIHNGKIKQIVGGTLTDKEDEAVTNFSSELDAAFYASMYKKDGLKGGHVILLNGKESKYYESTKRQALCALKAYPKGLQIGGGITADNATEYLEAGASHVIVTSWAFQDGLVKWENLKRLREVAGKKQIVLDLSCRKKEGMYYIVTDRWQKFTNVELTPNLMNELAEFCDEFLVHGVDVEGKSAGVEDELVKKLASWNQIPITYAGGIGTLEELYRFAALCEGKLDFTIGSALDLFGGAIPYKKITKIIALH